MCTNRNLAVEKMIAFFPVARLRNLGKQVEAKRFANLTRHLNSTDTLIAGVFYRFALDERCPALFIKIPKENDEPMPGMVYVKDVPIEHIVGLSESMINYVNNCEKLSYLRVSDDVLLCVKTSFKLGDWSNCGYEYAGKDGISIPNY